jgi:hypothetical protein
VSNTEYRNVIVVRQIEEVVVACFIIVAKVRERLAVRKQAALKFVSRL